VAGGVGDGPAQPAAAGAIVLEDARRFARIALELEAECEIAGDRGPVGLDRGRGAEQLKPRREEPRRTLRLRGAFAAAAPHQEQEGGAE
jgi:hypothetical protein